MVSNVVMKLVLATKNRHKAEEIQNFLRDLPLEIVSLDVFSNIILREEGSSLRENAMHKARTVAAATKEWALADDTGLFVDALGGRPGIFSARFSGEAATFQENVEQLLKEMEGVANKDRTAYFSSVLALAQADGREVVVEGRLEGLITHTPAGEKGFGYDPIFFLPDRGRTLAELNLEEKNQISHRGRALFKMRGVLEGIMKMENRK